MTVRVTTLKGADAGRYYTERLPSYYLDSGEPPGHWWGKAASHLGLAGEMEPGAFLAMMAGRHPATGEDLGRHHGEDSVRGYDATFSAPKSVSVLFALGDDRVREETVEAHERAVEAVLGWVESRAHTRLRRHGQVVTVDAEGIMVGIFRQHTSRSLDPQLHTHAVIANRVGVPDGRWLALDARTIKIDQRTLSALYHANLRSELTRRLGVRWQPPEHGIAEIADIDHEVLAEFSQRTNDVKRRLDEKLERFRTNLGREPTTKERWSLEREAVLDSRPAKRHDVRYAELRQEWRERIRELGHDPQRLIETALSHQRHLEGIDSATAGRMFDQAITSLTERQSSWRPAELVRELAAVVPTTVTADADQLTQFVELLAAQAATGRCVDISRPEPAGVALRRDGRPISEAAVDRALTTQDILDEEEQLIGWAQHRLTGRATRTWWPATVAGDGLSPAQSEAVAAVGGRGGLELIVGPAGAGKTTTLAAAATGLEAQGRTVFGVAPTATAAEVLATETGMTTDTLDKLLTEHRGLGRPPQPEYDLRPGTTVIVDEAGTASTPKLAALARLADGNNWRVVLVGDPRQFSAVGRGGMFAHLVDIHGAVELDRVHRFRHHWERQASLRLRAGDPGVFTEYEQRGRIHGGSQAQMETETVTAWQQARDRGDTVALMANNTETAVRLNHLAQQMRIEAGELDPAKRGLRIGDERLLVGDEVVTRRNDRHLRTDQGLMVKNRDHWTITSIHRDGSITLTGRTGTIRLPAEYVTEHVEFGYAQTSHASQGRTVDTSLLLLDGPTDSRGVYTPMTRGRKANHAYVVTGDNQTALDVLTQALSRDWIDMPALARKAQLDPHLALQLARSGPGTEDEIDNLERRLRGLIARRQERHREVGRTLGRGL